MNYYYTTENLIDDYVIDGNELDKLITRYIETKWDDPLELMYKYNKTDLIEEF